MHRWIWALSSNIDLSGGHLHFIRGTNMQFSAITMRMHFFTFYMRIYAYFGVRSNTIGIDFILSIPGRDILYQINVPMCNQHLPGHPTKVFLYSTMKEANLTFLLKGQKFIWSEHWTNLVVLENWQIYIIIHVSMNSTITIWFLPYLGKGVILDGAIKVNAPLIITMLRARLYFKKNKLTSMSLWPWTEVKEWAKLLALSYL